MLKTELHIDLSIEFIGEPNIQESSEKIVFFQTLYSRVLELAKNKQ